MNAPVSHSIQASPASIWSTTPEMQSQPASTQVMLKHRAHGTKREGFGQVRRIKGVGLGEVCNGSPDLQQPMGDPAGQAVLVDGVVPQAELQGEMGDAHMGLQARLMSQALRKLTAITSRTNCTIIFINQVRHKIGVTYGNGEVTTGGNALKFYSSLRIEIRRIGAIKDGDDVIGNKTRIKVVKNKLAPPFKTLEVEIIFGRGICRAGDLIKLAQDKGLLTCSGSWYSHGDTKLGQGKERVRDMLLKDDKFFSRLASELTAPPTEQIAVAK